MALLPEMSSSLRTVDMAKDAKEGYLIPTSDLFDSLEGSGDASVKGVRWFAPYETERRGSNLPPFSTPV